MGPFSRQDIFVDHPFAKSLPLSSPMKNILRPITAGLVSAFVAITAYAADLAPGAYSAGAVKGDVSYSDSSGGSFSPLASGTALSQGAVVKTGADSSVSIVFSSGSVLLVESDSTVQVSKFQQEVFSGPIAADVEPSVSDTQINVVDGSVIAKVAKLKKGSSFAVNSPVGAAGVRGTTFRVTYNAATKTLRVFTVSGKVVTKSSSGTAETNVDAGTQVTYAPDVEVRKEDLPPEVQTAIDTAIQNVSVSRGETTVVPTISISNQTNDKVDITVVSPN